MLEGMCDLQNCQAREQCYAQCDATYPPVDPEGGTGFVP